LLLNPTVFPLSQLLHDAVVAQVITTLLNTGIHGGHQHAVVSGTSSKQLVAINYPLARP
jgi:hypothetical protein